MENVTLYVTDVTREKKSSFVCLEDAAGSTEVSFPVPRKISFFPHQEVILRPARADIAEKMHNTDTGTLTFFGEVDGFDVSKRDDSTQIVVAITKGYFTLKTKTDDIKNDFKNFAINEKVGFWLSYGEDEKKLRRKTE